MFIPNDQIKEIHLFLMTMSFQINILYIQKMYYCCRKISPLKHLSRQYHLHITLNFNNWYIFDSTQWEERGGKGNTAKGVYLAGHQINKESNSNKGGHSCFFFFNPLLSFPFRGLPVKKLSV